jgi:signal transduction histidine kinase
MCFRKAYSLLIGCFWFIGSSIFAQEQKIADSLARIYQQNTLTGKAKFELLVDLSFNETRDLKKGLKYAEELINLSERNRNDKYLRVGYFLKGTKKRMLGQLDQAVDAYFKSAEIARKSNHLRGEAEAYGAIGDTYALAVNYPNAMQYYRRSIMILRQANIDSTTLASVLTNTGDAYLNSGHYDSALVYFNEAKQIFDRANYKSGIGYNLGNIGMVYANTGKDDLAEKYMNEAIRILGEAQDYYPICVYLISMSEVYSKKGDNKTALNYALRSLHLAEQHQLNKEISDASLRVSHLYDSAGNTKEAFDNYKKHIVYRDSVNNLQTVQKMADERTAFEVAQKQIQVNMLSREKNKQQIIVISLFVILGLAMTLLVTLYWFYKSKSKEKMRLHQQELLHARLEIQEQTYQNISQELHDNVGQVLSVVKMNINTIDVNSPQIARDKLAESSDLLAKVMQDIRDISKTLNTDFLNEIGLPNAIDQQLQLLRRTGLFSTELFVKGDAYDLGPERDLLVFRVVQELLNNIVKHAGADNIVVSMNYETKKLLINVQDNGKGFDIETQQQYPTKGLGLRNIHNRLRLINGAISFESKEAKGTTATIEILK